MVHEILGKPFYYGVMVSNGKYYKGNHPPIITKELFDKANDILTGKNHSKKQKYQFPLRGFMTCAICDCMLTAVRRKGRYTYYYCTNGKGICTQRQKHLTAKEVDGMIAPLLSNIQIDEELLEIAFAANQEKYHHEADSLEAVRQNLQNRLQSLQDSQNRLLDTYVAGSVPKELYEAKMTCLKNERTALEVELVNVGRKTDNPKITFEQIKNVFLQANAMQNAFLNGDDLQKREIAETVLLNTSVKDGKVLNYLFKMPYQRIAETANKSDIEQLRVRPDLNR